MIQNSWINLKIKLIVPKTTNIHQYFLANGSEEYLAQIPAPIKSKGMINS